MELSKTLGLNTSSVLGVSKEELDKLSTNKWNNDYVDEML